MSDDNKKLSAADLIEEYSAALKGNAADDADDTVIGAEKDIIEDTPAPEDDGSGTDGVISDEKEAPIIKDRPAETTPGKSEPVYDPDEYEPDSIDLFKGFDEIVPDPQADEISTASSDDEDDIFEMLEGEPDSKKKDEAEKKDPEVSDSSEEKDKKQKKSSRIRDLFPEKGDSVLEIIRKTVFLAAVTVFIAAGVMLVSTLIQSRRALDLKNNLTSELEQFEVETVTSIDEEGNVIEIEPDQETLDKAALDKVQYLKNKNPDTVAYLTIKNVDIYEPIVQYTDNSYYLSHAFDGSNNKAGTVFLDYRAHINADGQSDTLLLYGHNQRDGTMFGNLKAYKRNAEYYKANPFFTFDTEYGSQKYVIFAYFVTNTLAKHDSNGEVFRYHNYPEFGNEETYDWYMSEIAKRNEIISPVDVQYGDKFIVLSTCSNEYADSRFVIFARRLRDGETEQSFDFSAAALNTGTSDIDWDAITSDQTTADPALTAETIDVTIKQDAADEFMNDMFDIISSVNAEESQGWDTYIETEHYASETTAAQTTEVLTTAPPETEASASVPETSADTSLSETTAETASQTSGSETSSVGSEIESESESDTETSAAS